MIGSSHVLLKNKIQLYRSISTAEAFPGDPGKHAEQE